MSRTPLNTTRPNVPVDSDSINNIYGALDAKCAVWLFPFMTEGSELLISNVAWCYHVFEQKNSTLSGDLRHKGWTLTV